MPLFAVLCNCRVTEQLSYGLFLFQQELCNAKKREVSTESHLKQVGECVIIKNHLSFSCRVVKSEGDNSMTS